ncbi:MAG: hypothetical protein ACR2MB_03090 [Acidimicrobiales bacterium]
MDRSLNWRRWCEVGGVCLAHFCLCVVAWLALWVAVPVASGQFRAVAIETGSMTPRIVPSDVVLIGRPTVVASERAP